MLADYSDVVPRTEFERMETSYRVCIIELRLYNTQKNSIIHFWITYIYIYILCMLGVGPVIEWLIDFRRWRLSSRVSSQITRLSQRNTSQFI